jgi:hypothetical protein
LSSATIAQPVAGAATWRLPLQTSSTYFATEGPY